MPSPNQAEDKVSEPPSPTPQVTCNHLVIRKGHSALLLVLNWVAMQEVVYGCEAKLEGGNFLQPGGVCREPEAFLAFPMPFPGGSPLTVLALCILGVFRGGPVTMPAVDAVHTNIHRSRFSTTEYLIDHGCQRCGPQPVELIHEAHRFPGGGVGKQRCGLPLPVPLKFRAQSPLKTHCSGRRTSNGCVNPCTATATTQIATRSRSGSSP